MPDLHVGVIIPSRLSAPQLPYVDQAVSSVEYAARSSSVNVTLCIVSEEKPSTRIRRRYPNAHVVHSKERGFGWMNNVALAYLEQTLRRPPDVLLLLNDDAFLAPDFFEVFKKLIIQKSDVDVFAPLILDANDDQVVDSFGVEYFVSGYAKNTTDRTISSTLATAGCMLLRWRAVQAMQSRYGFFFNTVYEYYFEDVDLSVRCVQSGSQIQRFSALKAYHYGSVSSGGKRNVYALRMTYRNMLWVMVCCWPAADLRTHLFSIVLMQLWAALYITRRCGVFSYPSLWWQTAQKWSELMELRKKIIPVYRHRSLHGVLSPFTFRTYHGKTIPALPPAV
jgi:GT2 family glycosyltransferase